MSLPHVSTVAFEGMEPREVDVQVHIGQGASTGGVFNVVGLADKAVGESRERVRAALNVVGLALPYIRITVNLAPPICPRTAAITICRSRLACSPRWVFCRRARWPATRRWASFRSIDGARPLRGVLPAAVATSAKNRSRICPAACGSEVAWASDVEIIAAPSLIALVNHIKGAQALLPPELKLAIGTVSAADLKNVKGQETAKRALEIAAVGGHNML